MRLFKFATTALSLSSLAMLLALTGCGGGDAKDKDKDAKKDGDKPAKDGNTPTPAGDKKAVTSGKGVLKGRVLLTGDKPDLAAMDKDFQENVKTDKSHCLADDAKPEEKGQQKWVIGADNGVANAVVFIQPADGTFFAFSADDEAVKSHKDKTVELRQPHCAFVPHTFTVFTEYLEKDGKTPKKTGEKLVAHNDTNEHDPAKKGIPHNLKWAGGATKPGNETIKAGESLPIDVKVSSKPVAFQCNIHTWMNANGFVLNHPYVAVTDKDGKFEIKNLPAGKVKLYVFHEAAEGKDGFVKDGEVVELTDGDNPMDFQIKAKK